MRFRKVRLISYDSARYANGSLEARYSTDTGVELRSRCRLDGLDPDAIAAVDADRYAKLWGLTSFGRIFATLLPVRLEVKALSLEPLEEERFRTWSIATLSENFHRMGQRPELDLSFSGERIVPRQAASGLAERAILLSGGGKETVVAGELLKRLEVPFDWYRSVQKTPVSRDIMRISGSGRLISGEWAIEIKGPDGFEEFRIQRLRRFYRRHRRRYGTLDWQSLMSPIVEGCLVAEVSGSRYVLTGSERSANDGNGVYVGDLEVNHQYAKSYAFEQEFSAFLAKYLHPDVRHVSLLMPFYELQIAKLFASHPQYFSTFVSCNKRIPDRPWCLECPKCAFVFLVLSAFLDEASMVQIFGMDLLSDPKQVQTFKQICGHGAHKPFECVGTQDESRLALYLASQRREASPLHPDLAAILPGAAEAGDLEKRILDAYNDENGLPHHWNERLRSLV